MYKQPENGVTFDADCQSNSRFLLKVIAITSTLEKNSVNEATTEDTSHSRLE